MSENDKTGTPWTGASWGHIFEGDGPPNRRAGWSLYDELWGEIMLRLEQTPKRWLHIPVATPDDVDRLRSALDNRAKKTNGAVIVRSKKSEKMVYVKRGPNWVAREAGDSVHIPAHPDDSLFENERQRAVRAENSNGNGKRKPGRPRKVQDYD